MAGHRELVQLLTAENRISGAILLWPDGLEILSVKAGILASGGIQVGHDCSTSVKGLYACG